MYEIAAPANEELTHLVLAQSSSHRAAGMQQRGSSSIWELTSITKTPKILVSNNLGFIATIMSTLDYQKAKN
ncbi:unnamed protein product, partial [Linum tenue]